MIFKFSLIKCSSFKYCKLIDGDMGAMENGKFLKYF